jgi:hypothetical protein
VTNKKDLFTYIHTYVYTYIRIYVCIYPYVYMYTHLYIYLKDGSKRRAVTVTNKKDEILEAPELKKGIKMNIHHSRCCMSVTFFLVMNIFF